MKNRLLNIIFAGCTAVAALACARIEELESVPQVEKVSMTFNAIVDDNSDKETKTMLEGQLGESYRKVMWQPGDEIAIVNNNDHNFQRFVNTNKENSYEGCFSGEISKEQTEHVAFYPYSSNLLKANQGFRYIWYKQPATQNYQEHSFASNAMPMIASFNTSQTSEIKFRNVFGVLAINLTGSETIKSISFSGKDANGKPIQVAGDFVITIAANRTDVSYQTAENNWDMTPINSVTLDCGDGVTLNPATPTAFYIALPPATYDNFTLLVTTTDGKTMLKHAEKPLTIKRANVTKTGSMPYVEVTTVDISLYGRSNCYLVSEEGMYSFDATTIGNGEFGLIDGVNFHTSDTRISPAKAELLWEDTPGVIGGVTFDGENISFLAHGFEGNALIAAKDENDNILWSWHIWVTDQPQDQVYENSKGTFTMLDRNIGATRADRGTGEQWREGSGLSFQWGRKDPFAENKFTNVNTQFTVAETILNPTKFASGNGQWTQEWNSEFWNEEKKTIYDPCPVGYRVPVMDVWAGFTLNGENADRLGNINYDGQAFDKGWYFYRNNNESTWYPVLHYIESWGGFIQQENEGHLWSAENTGWSSRYFGWGYYSDYECHVRVKDHEHDPVYAFSVRCMKDELANHVAVRLNNATDVTSTTAHASASVSVQGSIEVQSAGFIYGTNPNLSLTSGTVLNSAAQDGVITYDITGLEPLTKYYIKAFAIASTGQEYYSEKTYSFITPNENGIVDLCINGSANCYVVLPVKGKYTFDLVKGNSSTSVGNATDMVVLWETGNNTNSVTIGSVIESADIENGKAVFEIPADAVSGNALIAAKDANGTILWSWHIWVADFDPEASAQTYISGAVMMDRNLGAIDIMPGTVESYGFYYQWGRKDPFVINGYMSTAPADAISYENYDSAHDTIETADKNPCVVYNDAEWGYNSSLWGSAKTIHDPCPNGWRVPDRYVWEGLSRAENAQEGYFQLSAESAWPTVYLPAAGRTDGDSNVQNYRNYGRYWTSNRRVYYDFYILNNSGSCYSGYGADNLMSVRCQKVDISDKPGSGDDYIVDDEYEWD